MKFYQNDEDLEMTLLARLSYPCFLLYKIYSQLSSEIFLIMHLNFQIWIELPVGRYQVLSLYTDFS